MTDFGRAPVRIPEHIQTARSNANRHAIYCLTLGTLLIGIATGLTFAEHVSTGLVAWLFLSGMLALVLANLVMMEA